MKSHARVVVIGGGVVGCSVLYHLAKAGWSDLLLIERAELTAGSTWHAAGGFHTLNGDPNVAKLQHYTVGLYKEIEELSGVSCGLHLTGGVMLAGTADRLDWLKMAHAKGRYLGMRTEIISSAEAKALMPLIDERRFVGALYDPFEGHLDPYGATHAYAKAARLKGAEIILRNRVVDLARRADGAWDVVTEQGVTRAEQVVNAGGLWAREVGRLAGVELPVLAMEHMYLITEDMPEVAAINAATGKEVITALDFEGEIYTRQERGGMLLGTYERAGRPWSEQVTPWDFGQTLLEPDLERIAPSLEIGFRHFPAFERAGIRKVINGPFTFAPDGNPLVGPVRGLPNFWVACGVMAGFSQGGGVGLALANWMTEGDPGFDVWGMDVARFGDFATPEWTKAKVRETYGRRFRIRFPNEELAAGRPLKTSPIHDRLKSVGAVFGEAYGLEIPLWFAPPGSEPRDEFSFRRSTDFAAVGAECRMVRRTAGVLDISGYAKYEVVGPGAEAFVARVFAGRIPETGRIVLSPMLNEQGKLIGDFTVARTSPSRFMIYGSGPAENYHLRWFEAHCPESAALRALGGGLTGLAVAGPASRAVLQTLTKADLSSEAFAFRAVRQITLGPVPAEVVRISFTGDLGYEIWTEPAYQQTLLDLLLEAGKPFGLGHFGYRALNALRLEKSFGILAREYRPVYGPYEAGLGRFLDSAREGFIGREAAAAQKAAGGGPMRLASFKLDARDADALGDEPIRYNGEVAGWVTSGGFAHWSDASVALGYIPAALAGETEGFEIEVISERRAATLLRAPLFDPGGGRMRA